MRTRYAQLPAGSDRNTFPLTDHAITEAIAGHPEAVNTRPYTSPIARLLREPHHHRAGGTR